MRIMQAMAGGGQGGAEAFFARLCLALDRAGATQRVVIRRDAWVGASLRAGGLTPVELPFGGWFDLSTRRRFRREIAAYRPDLVLTWMSRATRSCPRGAFVHAARLGGYYRLRNYRHCDHLIGNTRHIVDWLVAQGWPAARAHYLPNFVADLRAPALPRASLDTPDGVPLLLALGRLHRNKAFDVLLDALVRVPDAYLWLAGAGPEDAALRAQAARLGLASRVRFLGWRQDTPALYAAADVFVCPSRIEPLGNVVIEAWAQGVPVVAAAASGPAALIRPEQTGLLTPLEDSSALAQALRRLIDDAALRATLAAAGRAAFQAEFTEAAVVRRYSEFFAAVLRDAGRNGGAGGACAA